jgi:DNA-binding FadR family transcriptional regulator
MRELLYDVIKRSQEIPDARQLACTHHVKILEGLKVHDPRKARSAMRKHLGVFQRRYEMLLKAAQSATSSNQELPTLVRS